MTSFLDDAILAHVHWRLRLKAAVDGGEVPDREVACSDSQCALGQWIHGEGKKHSKLAEYRCLVDAHRKFHISIGKVIDLVAARKLAAAQVELARGEFATYSIETVAAITRLSTQI